VGGRKSTCSTSKSISRKIFHKFVGWLTRDIYADFLDAELPNLLEDIPLVFRINDWFQHDGAPPHFSRRAREILDHPDRWIVRGGPPI
jgi:hypothetical protein